MDKYVRLTTGVEEGGEMCIACAKMGTNACIGNCASCDVMRAILTQLWAFEEWYCAQRGDGARNG